MLSQYSWQDSPKIVQQCLLKHFKIDGKHIYPNIQLINNNIITLGYYNESGICVPIHENAHLEVEQPLLAVLILHDDVLLANGFVNPIVYEEQEKVA